MRLSTHFQSGEFSCGCSCGEQTVSINLIAILEEVRTHFGVPIKVTSGRRCARHNARVGGATGSQHLLGTAADIQVFGKSPKAVADYVESLDEFVGGLGRYKSFTHIDVRGRNARWGNN